MGMSDDGIIYKKELEGKLALVTGGTKGGIGEAIVRRLSLAGAKVITTARRIPEDRL